MKRDEAIAEVRSLSLRCRGPKNVSGTFAMSALADIMGRITSGALTVSPADDGAWFTAGETTRLAALTSAETGGGVPQSILNDLLLHGHNGAAGQLDAALRMGCNADFTDVIVAGPLDGQVHDYTCGSCGVQGTYRAPFFEIDG